MGRGTISLVDPFLWLLGVLEGVPPCELLPGIGRSPYPYLDPLLAFFCVGKRMRAFRSTTLERYLSTISSSNFLVLANRMKPNSGDLPQIYVQFHAKDQQFGIIEITGGTRFIIFKMTKSLEYFLMPITSTKDSVVILPFTTYTNLIFMVF